MKPIEQKQIAFQGSDITAVMVQDKNGREQIYVPMKPLVEGLGLSWRSQINRLKRNPVLSDALRSVFITKTEPNRTRRIKMLCIPISHLNGYLFGVDTSRVRGDLRPLIIEYQKRCYEVLFNAFNGTDSMRRFYSAIGHDGEWIGARIENHMSSTALADVWLLHGVPVENHPHLQDIINKGTFGLTVAEHKQFKRVPESERLQDHMTRPELLIAALADEAAAQSTREDSPQTVDEHDQIAKASGETGAAVREAYESKTKGRVLSDKNHLDKQLTKGKQQ